MRMRAYARHIKTPHYFTKRNAVVPEAGNGM